ncbi:MAG: ribosome biogenesis GTPase YlqF [Firmicutes bacterium]|nr:ribosome biogenesis GTPase YlqF [Bacillota bacterium]
MSGNIKNLNWYPGHMKKTRELIQENLKMVDLVIEVIDSRIPRSSRNPIIDELIQNKKRIIILNKSDLSDDKANDEWAKYFKAQGNLVLKLNSNRGDGVKELFKMLEKLQEEKNRDKALKKPLRMMIVGVPNVGKSSLINRMTGRKSAKTGDKPGVTKGKQWLSVDNGMQLLDTPGILWPKFEDPKVGLNLAFCGSIKDEIMDISELALELIKVLSVDYPELLIERYKLDEILKDGDYSETFGREIDGEQEAALANMEEIAKKRGFILAGKRIDYERTAKTLLDEFRSSAIGKITLEKVSSDD